MDSNFCLLFQRESSEHSNISENPKQELIGTLERHDHSVTHLRIVKTCKWLLSGALDGNIYAWDLFGHAFRGEFKKHKKRITGIEFSIVHNVLVTSSYEEDAIGWDVSTREEIFCLKGHRSAIHALTLVNVEGTQLAVTCDKLGAFKVWDIHRGLSGNVSCITGFVGGNVCPLLMTSCGDGSTLVCGERKLHCFRCEEMQVSETVPRIALYNSASGTILTAGGQHIQIWNAVTGRLKNEFYNVTRGTQSKSKGGQKIQGGESEISSLCLDEIQGKFLIGTSDGEVLYFRYSNGALLRQVDDPHSGKDVVGLAEVGGGDRMCVSCAWDGKIAVHFDDKVDESEQGKSGEDAQITTLRKVERAVPDGERFTAFAFSRKLSLIVTASSGFELRCFDFCQMNRLAQLHGHRSEVTCVALIEEYAVLVSGDSRGVFRLWSVRPRNFNLLMLWKNEPTNRDREEFTHIHSKSAKALARVKAAAESEARARKKAMEESDDEERARKWVSARNALKEAEDLYEKAKKEDAKERKVPMAGITHIKVSLCAPPDIDDDDYDVKNNSGNNKTNYLLFSADDRGNVKTWKLDHLFDQLELNPLQSHEFPCNRMGYTPRQVTERYGNDESNLTSTEIGESNKNYRERLRKYRHFCARKRDPRNKAEFEDAKMKRLKELRLRNARKMEEKRMMNRKERRILHENESATFIASMARMRQARFQFKEMKKKYVAPEILYAWRAHTSHLTSLTVISPDKSVIARTPSLLLTASTDLSVKLWGSNGEARGVLRQSEADQRLVDNGELPWVYWNFCGNPELVARQERNEAKVRRIQDDVQKIRDAEQQSKRLSRRRAMRSNTFDFDLRSSEEKVTDERTSTSSTTKEMEFRLKTRRNVLTQLLTGEEVEKVSEILPDFRMHDEKVDVELNTEEDDGGDRTGMDRRVLAMMEGGYYSESENEEKDENASDDDNVDLDEILGLRSSRSPKRNHGNFAAGSPVAAARQQSPRKKNENVDEEEDFLPKSGVAQTRADSLRCSNPPVLALGGVKQRAVARYPHLVTETKRILQAPIYTGESRPVKMAAFKEVVTGPLGFPEVRGKRLDDLSATPTNNDDKDIDTFQKIVNAMESELRDDRIHMKKKHKEFQMRMAEKEEDGECIELAYGLRGDRIKQMLTAIDNRKYRPGYFGNSRQRALRTREHRFATQEGKVNARRLMDECEELLGLMGEATRPKTSQRQAQWWDRQYDWHIKSELELGRKAAARRRRAGLPAVNFKARQRAEAAAVRRAGRNSRNMRRGRVGSRRQGGGSRPSYSRGGGGGGRHGAGGSRPNFSRGTTNMMIAGEFSRGSGKNSMIDGEFGDESNSMFGGGSLSYGEFSGSDEEDHDQVFEISNNNRGMFARATSNHERFSGLSEIGEAIIQE
eukprot:g6374.t1